MRLAAAKLPVTTEMIDRTTSARVGFSAVDVVAATPKVITAGQHALAMSALSAVEVEKTAEEIAL